MKKWVFFTSNNLENMITLKEKDIALCSPSCTLQWRMMGFATKAFPKLQQCFLSAAQTKKTELWPRIIEFFNATNRFAFYFSHDARNDEIHPGMKTQIILFIFHKDLYQIQCVTTHLVIALVQSKKGSATRDLMRFRNLFPWKKPLKNASWFILVAVKTRSYRPSLTWKQGESKFLLLLIWREP